MGRPDATDEEVIAAAKACHAHGFIKRLSDGYDTVIGEDGGSLSQGQKQLLSIARVMLCQPPMLILDEATSSIDTRTEIKIQDAFAKLMKGRTSFIVAHRLSTIRECRPDSGDEGWTVSLSREIMKNCWNRKGFIISYITASLLIKKVLCHLGRIGICSDYKKNIRAYTEWNDAPDFMCVWLKLSRTHVRTGAFD